MPMELRHLRYFTTVAEEGHITGAAERLGIQQPPLSRVIKKLEKELDVQLFRRTPHGVQLTAAGDLFHTKARSILASLGDAVETTRRVARGEQGRICLGISPTGIFHPLVTRIIRDFRERFPLVSVTLEENLSNDIVEGIRNSRVDAAFLWTPPSEGFVVDPVLHDELVMALPRSHALARADKRKNDAGIALKSFASETFIVYGRKDGFGLFAATIAAAHAAGFSPRFGVEAPRISSALSLAAAGSGVFLVPSSVQRLNIDGVVFRRLRGPPQPVSTLSLVTRRGDASPVVRRFLHVVRKAAKEELSK
jgi:DNA-binding transcriptional LysR family regulator